MQTGQVGGIPIEKKGGVRRGKLGRFTGRNYLLILPYTITRLALSKETV